MRPLLVVALLPLLMTLPGPAQAANEAQECQGLPVTVVGEPGRFTNVYGTDGDDVIVTNGASRVFALGGNDTICATVDVVSSIDAGPGKDAVDARGVAVSTIYLGAGDDTFWGNGSRVYTDAPGPGGGGTDTVNGGSLQDVVITGVKGAPDDDILDLEGGPDSISVLGTSTGTISAGAGHDYLTWASAEGSDYWVFDNRRGYASHARGYYVAEWSGLEDFDLGALADRDVVFVGSSASEWLRSVGRMDGRRSWTGSIKASMAGGDDKLWVNGDQHPRLQGGTGRDRLRYHAPRSNIVSGVPVNMSLREGTVRSRGAIVSRFYSFEDAILAGPPDSTLVGTPGPNGLTLHTCGRVRGLGSDDRVKVHYGKNAACDSGRGVSLSGGPGDDYLRGGKWRDSLYGGRGDDEAYGGSGSDLCVAERRLLCER